MDKKIKQMKEMGSLIIKEDSYGYVRNASPWYQFYWSQSMTPCCNDHQAPGEKDNQACCP